MSEPKPFGVQVKKPSESRYAPVGAVTGEPVDPWDGSLTSVSEYGIANGDWAVLLPHSCDSWVIATGGREHTIAEARRFRDELDKAIAMLESE